MLMLCLILTCPITVSEHRTHRLRMRPIATVEVAWSAVRAVVSVRLLITAASPVETNETIEMAFGWESEEPE